jgi:protoporphyrin/coproporphyrin ferrochelatase
MSLSRRSAIVLLQLGGPDTLGAVEPFLYNLFCDPDIIDLPLAFLFRKPLARFISSRRAPKVQVYYKNIGGGSPILRLTRRQAAALEQCTGVPVHVAMRYWHPFTDETVERLKKENVEHVVLLPLYPQYSKSTTGSAASEWKRAGARCNFAPSVSLVEEYCEHPLYIRSLVENITLALRRVPAVDRAKVHLVFSAHGTPMKLVREGDPYQGQVVRTYNAVVRAGGFGLQHHLCFQSKVGPQKWLEPSLLQTVDTLAAGGVSHLLVIPIAFVSDHSETLWEINMEVRRHALSRGIRYYDMMPALNTNPSFIGALADLAGAHLT